MEIVPTFVGFRRSDRQTFENAFERFEAIADDLQAVGCNIIVVSGTPPILLKGLDFERERGDRLSQKIGLPVVSQMEPHALALQALGVKRVAIATYYGDELNNAIVRYFGRFDIEGMVLGGLHLAGRQEALYTTSLRALDEVSYMQVYQYCKTGYQALKQPVDAIYVNGGGWDAPPAIDLLERDLGKRWSSRWPRKCGQPIDASRSSFRSPIAALCCATISRCRRVCEPQWRREWLLRWKIIVTGAAQGMAARWRCAWRRRGHTSRSGTRRPMAPRKPRGCVGSEVRCRARGGSMSALPMRSKPRWPLSSGNGARREDWSTMRQFFARAGARHAAIGMGARVARQSHR